MAELAHHKSVRAGHKGIVTKKVADLEIALQATPLDRDVLENLKSSFEEKVTVLSDLDGRIIDLLVDQAEIIAEIEGAEGVKDTLRTALLKINRALGTTVMASTGTTVGATPTPTSMAIKLPQLTLIPFNGDPTKWKTFWETYESAINSRSDLSDVNKFTYLMSLLTHSAKDAVAGLSLTAANYREAIDILKKRFGDDAQIITKHMEAFTGLEAVTDSRDLVALRQLYDKIEIHVRGLKSLGVAHDAYGALLTPLLMKKLPQELRVLISRKMIGKEWEFHAIVEALLEEIEARERVSVISKRAVPPLRNKREYPSSTTLSTKSSSKSIYCYCNAEHESESCEKVVSLEARRQHLKTHGSCFNCLRRGHRVRECRAPPRCVECKSKHHPSICMKKVKESSKEDTNETTNLAANIHSPVVNMPQIGAIHTVLLQTVQATVFNPSNTSLFVNVKIILDSGSQRSYMTQELKQRIAIKPCSRRNMSIVTFGSNKEKQQMCDVVKVGLRTLEGTDLILSLLAVPRICGNVPSMSCKEHYDHLSDLNLVMPDEGEPQILIGLDYYWSLVTGEIIQGDSGPVAMYTKLGWVLSGPVLFQDDNVSTIITHVLKVQADPTNRELDKRLKTFWDLESLGIIDTEDSVYDQLDSHIVFCNGRYQLSLPWKDPCTSVSDNLFLCQRRLRSLLKRLRRSPELLQEYDHIIQQQLRCGIIERVEEPSHQDGIRVHYLPHHAVIRRDKETSKVRIVYDASASEEGPSLNACLHTGPKFNQSIFDILLRFRIYKVALIADIEKAFLMILIDKKDRDVLRFLWIDDTTKDSPTFIILRFTRVVFGVTLSPFLLNATIRYHLEQFRESHDALKLNIVKCY